MSYLDSSLASIARRGNVQRVATDAFWNEPKIGGRRNAAYLGLADGHGEVTSGFEGL